MKIQTGKIYTYLWFSIVFFLFAIAYKHFFVDIKNTPQQNIVVVTNKLQEEISSVDKEISNIKRTIINSPNLSFSSLLLLEADCPYYVYSNKRIIFWSNNLFTPKYRDVLGDFKLSYVQTKNGKYVIRKEQFLHGSKSFEIVFLIPINEHPAVINEYLKSTYNKKLFTDTNFEISDVSSDQGFHVVEVNGEKLFSVKFGNTYSNIERKSNKIILFLIIFSFVFITIFIKKRLNNFVRAGDVSLGFLFLLSSLFTIRSLMLISRYFYDIVYLDLFDPKHYASSLVNPSLGDLLLNMVSLLILGNYIFNNFFKSHATKSIIKSNKRTQFIISIVCVFFSFFWLGVHHQTLKTLNFDSQWSMDITQNLEFDYLKVISFLIFFISVVVYFLFSHVCFRLYLQLVRFRGRRYVFSLVFGLIAFLLFALVLHWEFAMIILVNSLFFLGIKFFKLPKSIGKIQYLTFIYFFSFGLPGAIIGIYANYQFSKNNTDFSKSRLANQLLVERNFFTELQLADVAKNISEDIYIKNRILSPYASKLIIEKKIRREYLHNLDKFDVQIYVFNYRGDPFEQFNIKDNYNDFKSRLSEFSTDTEGLYFVNQARGQAIIRYLTFIEIKDRGQLIGYVLLDLTQKRFVPNSVFPLLLNENLYAQQIDDTEQFSYGVFNGGELQYNFGEFNYRKNLPTFIENANKLFDNSVRIGGFDHKAFKGEGDKFVIVSAKKEPFKARFANFSFLFLVYVFSILLILIVVTLYQSINHIKINYATKIQLYLNFAFFTPLIIVSITTMSIIIQTFKSSLENQYFKYAENLSAEVSGPLKEYKGDREAFSDLIFEIAEIADLDINVFINNGRLVASSFFQIYQNEILSSNIDPRAYIKIIEEKELAFVLEEQVGLLKYKNVYVGIRSYDTGSIIGILSLPFFTSHKDLERNIVEVLSNVLNIFTFVFIIFLFVSFFVSRGLTFPLRLITQKIKRTTLSAYNEPLSWKSEDEIGLMVAEYNRMLLNLEASKKALAESEKETAWQEMARQVAHEIKNPLTPMKLTLQHMRRKIEDGTDNEKSENKLKQIGTLLDQIETLSDIATSFSDFAKMPDPRSEKLDISELLKETIDLYNKKELGQIIANINGGNFIIRGDRKWLGRAFSNLIINGYQAAHDQSTAKIEVDLLEISKDIVRVEIKDHGTGIPDHIKDKIFTPNFSTKYTGSGLGLAIVKKGIEHANGKIWFKSEVGAGTIFYIELPLV